MYQIWGVYRPIIVAYKFLKRFQIACFVSKRGRLGGMCGPHLTFVPSVLVEYRRRSRRLVCELLLQAADTAGN